MTRVLNGRLGLFVFVGLALAALLILNFSKGITLFNSTYKLHVIMPTRRRPQTHRRRDDGRRAHRQGRRHRPWPQTADRWTSR